MSPARRLTLALALALTPGALAALAMIGCESERTREERQAQEQPAERDKAALVRREGPGAGEKILAFAEQRREFHLQTERDLAELDRTIASLEHDAATASGEAKRGLNDALVKARAARAAAQRDLEAADAAIEANWGPLKESVRRHLGEAHVSVETHPLPR